MNSEKLAQATPGNGASNAADFQPPTQNPQTIPQDVVQQQTGLQGVTNPQEFFNQQQNARISVASEPAPASAAANPTNDAMGLLFVAATVLAVMFVINFLRGQRQTLKPPMNYEESTAETESDEEATENVTVAEAPTAKPKSKKAATKRKAAKKAKRRRK